MIRLFVRLILSVCANAVGLLVASLLLDDFSINGLSFVVAVLLFTVSTAVLGPFITKIALTKASYLMGGIALVTTFVGLLLTEVFTDGINISGASTWIVATLIVWIFSIIANIVLPIFMFKKILEDKKEN